jgi:phenylacetate-CoA ligase
MSLLGTALERVRSAVGEGYETLPDVAQDLVCSAYGAQELVRRRGLPAQAARVRASIECLHWDETSLDRIVRERLRLVLDAARGLAGYADVPRRLDDPVAELTHWPILGKEPVRQTPEGFLTRPIASTDICTWTSGTTGGAMAVWKPRSAVRELFLSRDVFMAWHGVEPTDRRATFTGKVAVPRDSERVWRLNLPGRQLVLSQYHISPATASAYYQVLKRWRPAVLGGYPSTMAGLARVLRGAGARLHIPVVESSGEVLTSEVRELLATVFSARVVDKYGSSENLAYACECPAGRKHLFAGYGVIEVVDADGGPVPVGEPGRILMTSLTNDLMPLVRYEVGDVGALGTAGRCPCGRTSPTIDSVQGRQDDTLATRDGRMGIAIGAFNTLRGMEGVEALQLVQHGFDEFEVRAVLNGARIERPSFETGIRAGLDRILGSDPRRTVRFDYPPDLERSPGGKIRNTIRTFEPDSSACLG